MFEDKLQKLKDDLKRKYPRLENIRTDNELDMYTDMYKAIEFDIPKGDIWNPLTEDYIDIWVYIKFNRNELENNNDLLELTEDKFNSIYGSELSNFIETHVRTLF